MWGWGARCQLQDTEQWCALVSCLCESRSSPLISSSRLSCHRCELFHCHEPGSGDHESNNQSPETLSCDWSVLKNDWLTLTSLTSLGAPSVRMASSSIMWWPMSLVSRVRVSVVTASAVRWTTCLSPALPGSDQETLLSLIVLRDMISSGPQSDSGDWPEEGWNKILRGRLPCWPQMAAVLILLTIMAPSL